MATHLGAGMTLGRWIQSAPTETLVAFGDDAVQSGRWRMRFEPTDATPEGLAAFEDGGRYVIQWRRTEGRWRMAVYIANRDGPSPCRAGLPPPCSPPGRAVRFSGP
jgi:hypothetical protein